MEDPTVSHPGRKQQVTFKRVKKWGKSSKRVQQLMLKLSLTQPQVPCSVPPWLACSPVGPQNWFPF
jgi:hypothetical protein